MSAGSFATSKRPSNYMKESAIKCKTSPDLVVFNPRWPTGIICRYWCCKAVGRIRIRSQPGPGDGASWFQGCLDQIRGSRVHAWCCQGCSTCSWKVSVICTLHDAPLFMFEAFVLEGGPSHPGGAIVPICSDCISLLRLMHMFVVGQARGVPDVDPSAPLPETPRE